MKNKPITVRVGVPEPSGQLVQAAYQAGLPVLFSANAFAKKGGNRAFSGFNLAAASKLPEGLDAALDSAGFVAANLYGRYRWSVAQYYDLVQSWAWSFHASMDFCMEPQVAGSKIVRRIRLNSTALGYHQCVNESKRRDAPLPMPVLQGWLPEDYLHCADLLAIKDWPDLVGIGSVCRRNLSGPDGIITIVETLDKELPKHVKFHMIGVKGSAVEILGDHPRFRSTDSMAWDYGLRCKVRTGRTQAMRAMAMLDWQRRQRNIQPVPWVSSVLAKHPAYRPATTPVAQMVNETVADWFADFLGDHEYAEIKVSVVQQAHEILLKLKHFGLESLQDSGDMVEQAVFEALLALPATDQL